MFVNRLTSDRLSSSQPVLMKGQNHPAPSLQESKLQKVPAVHEAFEVSLCDEGMCFLSDTPHDIGAVLAVNFQPDGGMDLLESEGVVVECIPLEHTSEGYQITMLFTGN